MSKTYNDNSCCENAAETWERKDVFANTAENGEKVSVFLDNFPRLWFCSKMNKLGVQKIVLFSYPVINKENS